MIRKWLKNGHFQPTFIRYFYRDPERVVPPGDHLLAPADGLIRGAEEGGDTLPCHRAEFLGHSCAAQPDIPVSTPRGISE